MTRRLAGVAFALATLVTPPVFAQAFPPDANFVPGTQGSRNIKVLGHIPLGRSFSGSDIEMEQELSRPYVYTSVMLQTGTNIISIKDPAKPAIIWQWRAPNPELLSGTGAMDNKYFKHKGRYYDVQSLQFGGQGPMADIGAHVIDVTGLPDTTRIIDKGYIRTPDTRGGFHNIYMYKHSDGRPILFTTGGNPGARVYDMDKFLAGAPDHGMLGRVPVPEGAVRSEGSNPGAGGYHDMYVAYDVANKRDVFYGAGSGGYHLYDVSDPAAPKLLSSIMGVSGVGGGHTFTPDPTGRYAVAETEYQYAPLRIFDLKPTGDTLAHRVGRPIGAWTARWKGLSHNHEVRWPYVFVSAYEDGLQIFNMMDPTNPYTVGYYDTYDGPNQRGWGGVQDPESGRGVTNGAFGVDVRNADGLIVIEDFRTGFWSFKMEGFDGWNGKQWGMPNISSAQDWDDGPEGAPKPQRIS